MGHLVRTGAGNIVPGYDPRTFQPIARRGLWRSYNTGCFKKSFTTLKAYRNLYRGHTQRFELSKCSKTHRVLPRIVIRNCYTIPFMHVVL